MSKSIIPNPVNRHIFDELNLKKNEWPIVDDKFITYILKSQYCNLIKIGRTRNLCQRLNAYRYGKYGEYKMKLIATIHANIEHSILISLYYSGAKPLFPPSKHLPEAFFMLPEDVDYIIDYYGFKRL